MQRLIEGYREFRRGYFQENRALFGHLAQGQRPHSMVITCSDSRIDPRLIFNASPGDMFILRNVANLVPPYSPDDRYHGTSAAIEFAVRSLAVEHIIILGHGRCGGVAALLGAHEGEFIGPWMRIAEPARDRALAAVGAGDAQALQRACEEETMKVSLANLMTFPWLREQVEAGHLKLHACHFVIEDGELQVLDQASGRFHGVG